MSEIIFPTHQLMSGLARHIHVSCCSCWFLSYCSKTSFQTIAHLFLCFIPHTKPQTSNFAASSFYSRTLFPTYFSTYTHSWLRAQLNKSFLFYVSLLNIVSIQRHRPIFIVFTNSVSESSFISDISYKLAYNIFFQLFLLFRN